MGLPVTVALLCRELESARLQEAALELSLPVARIGGLAVWRWRLFWLLLASSCSCASGAPYIHS